MGPFLKCYVIFFGPYGPIDIYELTLLFLHIFPYLCASESKGLNRHSLNPNLRCKRD